MTHHDRFESLHSQLFLVMIALVIPVAITLCDVVENDVQAFVQEGRNQISGDVYPDGSRGEFKRPDRMHSLAEPATDLLVVMDVCQADSPWRIIRAGIVIRVCVEDTMNAA